MPYPSKLPDDDSVLLRARHVEGLSLGQIAERYGVHKSNVSRRFDKIGHPVGSMNALDYQELLPWDIDRKHLADYPALMLYAHIRYASGIDVPAPTMSRLRGWWRKLTADDVVLHYAQGPQGVSGAWLYVPREESDGRLVIRWPSEAPPTRKQASILTLPQD